MAKYYQKDETVFYVAGDGKHIRQGKVRGLFYRVTIDGGKESFVNVETCSNSAKGLITKMNNAIKDKIVAAYFGVIDALAETIQPSLPGTETVAETREARTVGKGEVIQLPMSGGAE